LWRQISSLPRARLEFSLVVVVSVVAGLTEAALLAVVAQAAVAISTTTDSAQGDAVGLRQLSHLSVPALLLIGFGLAVVRLVAQVVNSWLPAKLGTDLQVSLRSRVLQAFLIASWEAKTELPAGRLQEVSTTLVDRAAGSVSLLATGLASAINFLALVVSAFLIGPIIALITGVTALVLSLAVRPLMRRTKSTAVEYTDAHAAYADATNEVNQLGQEFLVFDAITPGIERIERHSEAVRRPLLRRSFLMAVMPATYQSLALVVVLGGLAAVYAFGSAHLAALGAVALLLIRSFAYSQQAQAVYQQFNDLAPASDVVEDLIARFVEHPAPQGTTRVASLSALALAGVEFSYPGREGVLRDISFQVEAGEAIGIVGPSGAGKSTLLQLLLRLRVPSAGEYLINGTSSRDCRYDDWWKLVGYVPQDTQLLSGTVAENIRFLRPDVSDAEVETAARAAHLHEEILRLPQGYDTPLSSRAAALSGGQRQRLCLARALAGSPGLIILDEPTSSLDMHSEELIQQSLRELRGSTTLVVVAHRPSTLTLCDRILRLENGRLVADERTAPV
jgi:ABC-type multidrug transport system fused ATPase/permease subunit